MRLRRPLPPPIALAALLVAVIAVSAATAPAAAAAADGITPGTIYRDGPDNRYLLGGEWLFRRDDADAGVNELWQRQAATDGWTPTRVPNAWNVGDNSVESMVGTVGWYRKDFRLPDRRRRMDWLVRFESVNYRAHVWLNGRPVGRNSGAYLPWDVRLPRGMLKRRGTNRLVVRVDNRRLPTDFPASGLTGAGGPSGGWWNYGGILREVYLQRVDRVDITSVVVRPRLRCTTCPAHVLARVVVRNYGDDPTTVGVSGSFGRRQLSFGSRRVGAKRFASFETRLRIARPRLWSPARPYLYRVRLAVRAGDRRVIGYRLRSGIRLIRIVGGRLHLNGRPLNVRGVGLHEDDPRVGFAIDSARRAQIVAQAKELGSTMLRSHYPLHPELHELADRAGLLIWSEIPVYGMRRRYLRSETVRKLAVRELENNIIANQNHASVLLWSVGNELPARPARAERAYFDQAARQAKALDPTRPVGLAIAGYPLAGCRPQYAALDVIGINDYFGWYAGPEGQIADREALAGYLDAMRACHRDKALFISEFGAEANRDGPVEEKGTYEFQRDFVNFHLGVYAARPWLSGALYWTLQEFRVRPGWEGGNPRPNPPMHEKGLLRYDGTKKPAWFDVQRSFAATPQLAAP